jgi:hypothetical protein
MSAGTLTGLYNNGCVSRLSSQGKSRCETSCRIQRLVVFTSSSIVIVFSLCINLVRLSSQRLYAQSLYSIVSSASFRKVVKAWLKLVYIFAIKKKEKKTPWSESASELYRPSDRRFSAKCCQLVRIEGATWSS